MTTDQVSRRRFISSTGVLMAGMAASPYLFADNRQNFRKVHVGVVGGRFGRSFYFDEHPNCVVEAVSDLIPARREALVKAYKCSKTYNSLEELIKDPKVDAVAIFTGVPDHARHTLACLEAGKHVLCAVPVAMNVADCQRVQDAVKWTGLTYMMAETSYYKPVTMAARRLHKEGKFGEIISAAAQYYHPGLEKLYFDEHKKRTWRHGLAPMHYPTHSTAYLIGVTGERLTSVSCSGWGDDSPIVKDNAYNNPFWKQTAFFLTDKGTPFEVGIAWRGALAGTDRGEWHGTKMSLYSDYKQQETHMVKVSDKMGVEEGGFAEAVPDVERYEPELLWKTDMLPPAMRHDTSHQGSHVFITHEFIDAIVNNREPAINIREAIAYTVPGIIAHESSLQGGRQLTIPQL